VLTPRIDRAGPVTIPARPGDTTMWTLDTRIDVTPLGRYVSRLRRADRKLDGLTYPGLQSTDPRVRREAEVAYQAAFNLRGELHDELARFGGLPSYPPDPDEELLPAPSDEERARFYREDDEARNASDGRGDLLSGR
jgi:hypothetical protein